MSTRHGISDRDNAPSFEEGEVCGAVWDHYTEMLCDVKRTHLAPSKTHGTGLFIDEHVLRSELIIEYAGERIKMATGDACDAILQLEGKTNDYMLRLCDT